VYLHDASHWRIGRVEGEHPQDTQKYLIAFPNGKGAVLPVEVFDVRWRLPIDDPFQVLESVGGDSPTVYDARLNLLSEWSRQRAAALGVQGLLLGSVELHAHQLKVVRRVANDPIKRYLLADEVGLGKTIEAGALISQFLAARPDARVLILAPDHLRAQWATELVQKFRINHCTSAWLRIRAHSDASTWPAEPVDLLVIDEAHHITRAGTLSVEAQRRVVELAHSADALLLLSATPVRSNEAAFLDLLHLLDPEHYLPDDLEAFVKRVELRDRLALTHQALGADIDAFDLSLYAKELATLFPNDLMLARLLSEATDSDDEARPSAVGRVREHLSETYRLHHRLLRTRRTAQLGATFQVRGRKRGAPFTLDVVDQSYELRCQLLDSLRLHLSAGVEQAELSSVQAVDIFREVAQRCGSLSHALNSIVERDEGTSRKDPVPRLLELIDKGLLPGWDPLIREIQTTQSSVVVDLADAISRVTLSRGVKRAVVATGFTECAEVTAKEVARSWGLDRVALHLETNTPQQNAAAIARWEGDGPCSLLFCDAGAEEGINLQNADLLIHIDLPWEAFRVEQRIGRCDRHTRVRAGPIPSIVVAYGDQPYARGWFEFLADGCGVFDRSVSSLQYILADTERAIQDRVLSDGFGALSAAVVEQAETLKIKQTKISAHDALDAIDIADNELGATADKELLISDEGTALTRALVTWLEGVGASLRTQGAGVIQIERKPRPQVPFELELAMAPSLDASLALDREAAVKRAVPILRAGHPLLDAVVEHLRHTDRGVVFTFFRPVPGLWPPAVVFRTDFLVTAAPDLDFFEEAAAAGLRPWVEQMVEDASPPLVETILMRADGVAATHPALLRPYDKQHGDLNLSSRPELFERLTAQVDWSSFCGNALRPARELLTGRPSIATRPRSAAEYVRRELIRSADRQRSRELVGLLDGANFDVAIRRILGAAPDRIEPRVDVLGCGGIILADAGPLGQYQ
jgi:ATP-dependent helicase HepA